MPLIERYIFRRAMQVLLFILGALMAVLWMTQVLRELDVVTAKGQAITIFLLMTVFGLPALVQVVAPIAFLVAVIITLDNLGSDGELLVISGAGATPKAVNRPIILLGVIVMLLVAFSHHILAPASRSKFRQLVTQVRADVIATLLTEGGFRTVDNGLTMHIRKKAPDGSFLDVFVNDDRDPARAVTFSAATGVLLQRGTGSFLVLRDGALIRTENASGASNVVSFDTYALDLSQLGSPDATPVYETQERSTLFLLSPKAIDSYALRYPQRVRAELHQRMTAPLFTLAFSFIALAFLGRPHSNRDDRSAAIAAVVLICLALRTGGFVADSIGRNLNGGIPFMYAVPLVGIAFGLYSTIDGARAKTPRLMTAAFDWVVGGLRRVVDVR